MNEKIEKIIKDLELLKKENKKEITNKIIICSNIKCKHRSNAGTCRCQKIMLTLNGIHTVNQGYQDYLKCGSFELDKSYEKMSNMLEKMLGDNK